MFALNPTNGAVLWRQTVNPLHYYANADGADGLYTFSADVLQKRSVPTGQLLWQTPLIPIPEQKTAPRPPPKKLGDYWMDFKDFVTGNSSRPLSITIAGGSLLTPNDFSYQPFISGSHIVVFREAWRGYGGCVQTTCFNDWLRFDASNGKFLQGGSGSLVARTTTTALFQNHSDFCAMHNDTIRFLDVEGGSFSFFRHEPTERQIKDRTLFYDARDGTNHVFLYAEKDGQLKTLNFPASTNYQFNCVLLNDHLLHYTACHRFPESTPKKAGISFELYDLNGKLLQRTAEIDPPPRSQGDWWVSFKGTFNKTIVVEVNGELWALQIPSLSRKRLSSAERASFEQTHRYGSLEDGPRIFEIGGDITIERMKTPITKHDLTVTANDSLTHELLWKHTEPVMIQKLKSANQ